MSATKPEAATCGCVVGTLHRYGCASVGYVDPPRTKPEAAGLTLVELLTDRIYDTGATYCGSDGEDSADFVNYPVRELSERLAAEVSRWLRAVLLGDEVVEAAARDVRAAVQIPPLGPSSQAVHAAGGSVHLTPSEASDAATAALTAALDRVEALITEEAGT